MPKSARPQLYTKAITADAVDIIGEPHIIYDISDYMPLKKQAIAAHRSQALEVNAITKQKLKEGADDPEAWIRYEQFWCIHSKTSEQQNDKTPSRSLAHRVERTKLAGNPNNKIYKEV
ncbi:hypothetical protein JCM19037_2118 [Geomicrobium sp. JCM 19037]|uniref:hypothetical protein n=1 Tax=Geomicrobium sp. JCM 19037 TaxID=1460634 RepID=UPI00045F2FC1|nr:hypothetical protein [Geomicrobium sp. JCM 19037]GAK03771.1 hypothetical protein JCM19037_2118 [Geomicrobium sp. JCM 19037]